MTKIKSKYIECRDSTCAAPILLSEAVKHDQGKARYDLVPWDAFQEVAKVLTFGATKYGDRNWEKGLTHGRLLAAAMRHISAHMQGKDRDSETGLPHLSHAITCLMMLLALWLRSAGTDDRV